MTAIESHPLIAKLKAAKVYPMIATPAHHGQVNIAYLHSMLALMELGRQAGIPIGRVVTDAGGLDLQRNEIAGGFRETPCTHLFFVDADMGFDPVDVLMMLATGHPVIGGVYAMKRLNWEAIRRAALEGVSAEALQSCGVAYTWAGEGTQQEMEVKIQDTSAGKRADAIVVAPKLGTGFLCIERSVFDAIETARPDLKYTSHAETTIGKPRVAFFNCGINKEGYFSGEDYNFCRLCADAGITVRAFLGAKLTHAGPVTFDGNVLVRELAQQASNSAVRVP